MTTPQVLTLIRAIGSRDFIEAQHLLAVTPELALESVDAGATRQEATSYFFEEIRHYVYAGDTALHIASAAHHPDLVSKLLDHGADVAARNRRGAQALHYAADGAAGSDDPGGQAAVIALLVAAGADPNAKDKSGVAPLHRAVRDRCSDAVRALLESGADPDLTNKSGSSPMKLATLTTGKSGSGSRRAREQQAMIIELLESRGAKC